MRTADQAVRLVEFVTLFASSGTERQVMNLAFGLDPARFDIEFACLKRWGDLLERIEASGRPIREYRVASLMAPSTLGLQLRFARDLRRRRIEIVHTYGFWTNVFGIPAARLAGTPVVIGAIRDTCDHITPAQRRAQRLACRLADAVLVNAEAIKRRLVEDGYDGDRIGVIANGVDLTPFEEARERGGLHRELGFPADAPVVAVFARLHPVKGIEYFLDAAGEVARQVPAARFLVVGEDRVVRNGAIVASDYRAELEARAARAGLAGRLVFTGFRRDVAAMLSDVSVSVLPCVANEGLSNSLLESMAAGVPVVATTVGGNPEVVEDGITGLLVRPRDAGALARAMVTLLADGELQARLGRAARRRVADRFSLEHMVRQTEGFYLDLLAKKAKRHPVPQLSEGRA
jgi:glycosyltransferase involved in cell wall biosynthesis